MGAFITSFRFLAGAIAGLLGSEALEDALTPSDVEPQQSLFSRVSIAVTVGIFVALFLEYLKRKKIL